jgi:hypothetical protein
MVICSAPASRRTNPASPRADRERGRSGGPSEGWGCSGRSTPHPTHGAVHPTVGDLEQGTLRSSKTRPTHAASGRYQLELVTGGQVTSAERSKLACENFSSHTLTLPSPRKRAEHTSRESVLQPSSFRIPARVPACREARRPSAARPPEPQPPTLRHRCSLGSPLDYNWNIPGEFSRGDSHPGQPLTPQRQPNLGTYGLGLEVWRRKESVATPKAPGRLRGERSLSLWEVPEHQEPSKSTTHQPVSGRDLPQRKRVDEGLAVDSEDME